MLKLMTTVLLSLSVRWGIDRKAPIGCIPFGELSPGPRILLTALSIGMFAICQGILLYCAGWTVYQTVPHTTAGWQDASALFHNRTFLDLAMSLLVSSGIKNTRSSPRRHMAFI